MCTLHVVALQERYSIKIFLHIHAMNLKILDSQLGTLYGQRTKLHYRSKHRHSTCYCFVTTVCYYESLPLGAINICYNTNLVLSHQCIILGRQSALMKIHKFSAEI
jgi:hypothetical protein